MKTASRAARVDRKPHPVAQADASGPGHGAALAPPRTGLDFVDHGLSATPPVQRRPGTEPPGLPAAPAVESGTRGGGAVPGGLPMPLRAGIESLSGLDLSDVRVHANSSHPARLQARAFTQGDEIHVGPGQERYLPHEAWHVVQQRQGRVRPTLQVGGVAINDDPDLEREADLLGTKAVAHAAPPAREPGLPATEVACPGPAVRCVQRAIGLEFEVKDWHVRHRDDKSKLEKGTEPVIEQDGVNLTADDDGDRSDIEWVTSALETRDEVLYVIDQARDLALDMQSKESKEGTPLPATDFSAHGSAHPNAEFEPGGAMSATMQATVGVPLGDLPALYRALADVDGLTAEKPKAALGRAGTAGLFDLGAKGEDFPAPPVPVDQMSDALKGFLLVVIDYLRTGFSGDGPKQPHEQFPKGNLNLLAKTSFQKMLKLVGDEAKLTVAEGKESGLVMREEWIDWIVQAAIPGADSGNLAEKRQRRVLDFEYGISNLERGKNEPAYTIDVSREEWLRSLPTEDMLRHDNPAKLATEKDTREPLALSDKLEGFAALGSKTDKCVTEVADELAEQIVESTKDEVLPESKGKERAEELKGGPAKGPTPPKEGVIFEMRHLSSTGGGPESWPVNAMKAWEIYTKAVGDQIYRAGNRQELENMPDAYGDIREHDLNPNLQGNDLKTDTIPTVRPSVPVAPVPAKPGRLRAIWNALTRRK